MTVFSIVCLLADIAEDIAQSTKIQISIFFLSKTQDLIIIVYSTNLDGIIDDIIVYITSQNDF